MALKLSFALDDTGHTSAIKDGSIPIEGVDAEFVQVDPIIAAFRKMVREEAYDICELAPTTYMAARAHGAKFKALPIILMRRFHHSSMVKRQDAGVSHPKNLEGKRVGVRAYTVTTGVWGRGIIQNEYGVDIDRIDWVVDDEEHVTALKLPPNVTHAPEGKSLAGMMSDGELAAGFSGPAGIGRSGAPGATWSAGGVSDTEYPLLIEDAAEAEKEWYRRTGIYPIHGLLVVRDAVLDANPWLPGALLEAFEAAKQPYLGGLRAGAAKSTLDKRYIEDMKTVGDDPLPYGMDINRPSIEALIQYAQQQKLITGSPRPEDVFVDV